MRYSLLIGALAMTTLAGLGHTQEPAPRPEPEARAERDSESERARVRRGWRWFADDDRAALGLSTSSSRKGDTLGLLITGITPDGPAEKAGLKEGDRIAAINNVNLRLSPADAGEPDMDGLTARRLRRELEKVEPGSAVELRVYADGRSKVVKVETVEASELRGRRVRWARGEREERAVIGVTLGGGGSRRDTLGVLIVRLEPDGPAEKAGLVEGDRIAAINGVNLRVARADAEEHGASHAMANRLRREMGKLKPGADVELRVYSGGKFRTVRLKAAKSSELYEDRRWGFMLPEGMGEFALPALPPAPPLPPLPARPHVDMDVEMRIDHDMEHEIEEQVHTSEQQLREAESHLREMRSRLRETERAARATEQRIVRALAPSPARPVLALAAAQEPAMQAVIPAGGSRDSYTVALPGLRLSPVDADLASYFGEESEGGLLVIEAAEPWDELRAGDVIIKINGGCLHDGEHSLHLLDSTRDHQVELLRKGERMVITLTRD